VEALVPYTLGNPAPKSPSTSDVPPTLRHPALQIDRLPWPQLHYWPTVRYTVPSLSRFSDKERVQNRAARIVCSTTAKCCAATPQPALAASSIQNWLQTGNTMFQVTDHRTTCLSIRTNPSYPYVLRLWIYNLLVPYCRTKLGRRRFSVAEPRVWNSLSGELRTDYNSLRT